MYWQHHVSHTRCADQKAQIALALKTMQDAFERHPCTGWLGPEVLADGKAWAADHAKAFQRASSAVEGRNGYWSQMQHNHRGLPKCRYPGVERRCPTSIGPNDRSYLAMGDAFFLPG